MLKAPRKNKEMGSPFVSDDKVGALPEGEKRPRNAAATRGRILKAAIAEFAEHGFSGGRMDAIAQRSESNMRMLYHYYGSKEDLYLVALEQVYGDIRHREELLSLDKLDPEEAMLKLFHFTYGYFGDHPEVVSLWSGENMLRGRFLSKSRRAAEMSSPLLTLIETTLKRGEEDAIFRPGVDPLQLYVSMVALSYFHLSNAYTLSAIFSTNLHSKKWKAERKRHATDMLMAYLLPVGQAAV
jgi:TetR/AcrR family transcriptional regulator